MPSVLRYSDAAVVTLVVVFRGCVIIFVRFSILLSLLSFVVACLLFLWWPGTYRIVYNFFLVATLGDRSYVALSSFCFDWCFVLITGITRTSFVVVPRKLLSSFCSTPLLFLSSSLDAVDLRCPFFCRPCGIRVELERTIVSVVLDPQLETLAITMALSLLADELVRRCFFVSSSVWSIVRLFWTLIATPWTNGSHRIVRCRIIF